MTKRVLAGASSLLWIACLAAAQAPERPGQAGASQPAITGVSLAVLDYEANVPGKAEIGTQIADILTARLGVEESLDIVDRAKLGRVLKEQKLNLVGPVDHEQAGKVGKLVGAKLLVTGKASVMDKKLTIFTWVMGVETGYRVGAIVQLDLNKGLADSLMQLSDLVAAQIRKDAPKLLPKDQTLSDPVEDVRKALKDLPRPAVAIVIPESSAGRPAAEAVAETEVRKVLAECGFTVVDRGPEVLADWAREMLKDPKGKAWPASLEKADVAVVGESFCEFAAGNGEAAAANARAAISLIDRRSGGVLLTGRQSHRTLDLPETLAGKTALQSAGRRLGVSIAQRLLEWSRQMSRPGGAPAPAAPAATTKPSGNI
jgi:hypothetical protein